MEKLIQLLIEKHKLDKLEAADAIRMVTDYLKRQYPELEKLIDNVLRKNEIPPKNN